MTSSLSRKLAASIERWPIAGAFTISRGAKTEAITVVATVSHVHDDLAPLDAFDAPPAMAVS